MLKGNSEGLRSVRLGTQISVAETIKVLGKAPPLSVLKLCYGSKKFDFAEYLLQLADDLDFTQDTLSSTCSSLQLNPILNGVLAGFNRRRRLGRFKCGHQTLEFDRLRFAQTASEKDSDLFATEMLEKKSKKSTRQPVGNRTSGPICRFYQKDEGCHRQPCMYSHRCIICNKSNHGAVNCIAARRNSKQWGQGEMAETREKPPDPRKRRARAL